jgi:Kef-type K+ transport system membrane component KefB
MNKTNALLLGLSMIPRAEIALVVVYQCSKLDVALVSDQVFAAMVVVSLATSVLSPLLLRQMLR